MNATLTRLSKFVSLVLRHQPETYGLALDAHGWARVDDLLAAAARAQVPLTRELLIEVVAENDKQRFVLSEDGSVIRARQGHSVQVDLQFVPLEPPEVLYHGTAARFLTSIRAQGLLPQARQHVHLSADRETATRVGARHGKPAILVVASGALHQAGHAFYRSENGVWLTAAVPVAYIAFPEA